jgi:hypothetical protein
LNLVINLLENLIIENNIFEYEKINKIKLIHIPEQIIIFNGENLDKILENNDILEPNYKLIQNNELIKNNNFYYLEYQYIIKEPEYETFYNTSKLVSDNDVNFSDYYIPRIFYGRTNTLKFKLCHKFCGSCQSYGISDNEQKCLSCLPEYQYDYFRFSETNCVPEGYYYNNETNQLVKCDKESYAFQFDEKSNKTFCFPYKYIDCTYYDFIHEICIFSNYSNIMILNKLIPSLINTYPKSEGLSLVIKGQENITFHLTTENNEKNFLNNSELNIGFYIARFGIQIFDMSSKQDSSKKNKTNQINYHCLIKLFNLLQMLFSFKLGDQNHYVNFIKPCLETFLEHDIIKNYKNYLLKIAEDYKRNKKDYTSRKTFDNQNFFDKQFENYIKGTNSLNSNLAFQIFFGLMKLVTKTFDVNALEDIPDILKDFLLPEDIFKILSIISLDIPLRIELIKFYRMIYIDISIDKSKIEKYRFKFHEELDSEVEEKTDGLISADSMKIFIFLQRLIKVSNYDFNCKSSKMEYELLFFEIKNF